MKSAVTQCLMAFFSRKSSGWMNPFNPFKHWLKGFIIININIHISISHECCILAEIKNNWNIPCCMCQCLQYTWPAARRCRWINKDDQMKSVWFSESSRNQSCHSWPPAWAACLLNWHWIQKRTAFVKAGANDGPACLERTDSRTETLSWSVPSHFSWWTQPDRVQKTLWGGAVWYQLPSCSAWQRVGWDPVDKGLSYIS